MGKKILFAVMALLVMATGNIWAQEEGEGGKTTDGSIAYVVLCNDNSLHFLCSNETLAEGGTLSIDGSTISKVWSGAEVLTTGARNPEWMSNNGKVTKVVIDASFKKARPQSCYCWFRDLKQCKTIEGIEYLNTSEVTNMQLMFYYCSSLTSLDLINFDTSNVANMEGMFMYCSKLTSLNLSNFVTSKVTRMKQMFRGCSELTTLNLSSFNTSIMENMSYMFYDCSSLTSLDLSNFDTSNVTYMQEMFRGCSSLTSLNLSNFVTSKVTHMFYMFDGCSKLESLDLSSFNTSEVEFAYSMFFRCSGLTTLTLGNFDMSKMDADLMFYGCSSLCLLDLSNVTKTEDVSKIIGKLPAESNPVIFISKDIEKPATNKNIVTENATCEKFEIDANNITTLSLPYSFKANSVTFKRSFAAGKAHTICLPFELNTSATADYKLYEYDAYEDGIVKFKDAQSTTTPHKPYLLVPNNTLEEITVENATISATTSEAAEAAEEEGFFGVYKKMVFTAEVLDGDYDYYGWTGNTDGKGEFRKAGEGAYVNACRAYIKLKKVSVNNAPARLSIELGDGTTGISSAKSDANGGMEAPVYNLQGQRVGSGYKGVVIKNGKKMTVK